MTTNRRVSEDAGAFPVFFFEFFKQILPPHGSPSLCGTVNISIEARMATDSG